MSREYEAYNVGRNLYLSKFCLECGLDSSLETYFQDISRSLAHLGIHIESTDIADAENIDEFLFDKLNEKEISLLTLGVAVGMIQSATMTLGTEESVPLPAQAKMLCTMGLAMQRVQMVLSELGCLEIGEDLFERIKPSLADFDLLKASNALIESEVQAFEDRIKGLFEEDQGSRRC